MRSGYSGAQPAEPHHECGGYAGPLQCMSVVAVRRDAEVDARVPAGPVTRRQERPGLPPDERGDEQHEDGEDEGGGRRSTPEDPRPAGVPSPPIGPRGWDDVG